MLSKDRDRTLLHRYWIKSNEVLCVRGLNGLCDQVGQNPDRYGNTMKVVSLYEFLYPFLTFLVWILFGFGFMFSVLVSIVGMIFLPIFPLLVVVSNFVLFLIIILVAIIIEIAYYLYLFRQIGIYTVIPLFAFVCSLVVMLIPQIGSGLSTAIGLIPWSLIALGVHYIHYQIGVGIVFNVDDHCYVRKEKEDFYLDW